LAITWVSDVDGALSSAAADSSGRTTFTTSGLALGAHAVTLTATDSDGMSGSAVVSFTVDGPPGAPTVALTPDPATSSDTLTATVVGPSADPEGDPVTYRYAWYVDGVVSGASTSASLPASATSRGEVWTVRVTPNDGYQDGAYAEASVTVGNGAFVAAGSAIGQDVPDNALAITRAPQINKDGWASEFRRKKIKEKAKKD
jgi:bifunctional UDP-N-acetylglucosamine pyrophosphorylase/glucosamine-1-phosphate N-acetyltransferase